MSALRPRVLLVILINFSPCIAPGDVGIWISDFLNSLVPHRPAKQPLRRNAARMLLCLNETRKQPRSFCAMKVPDTTFLETWEHALCIVLESRADTQGWCTRWFCSVPPLEPGFELQLCHLPSSHAEIICSLLCASDSVSVRGDNNNTYLSRLMWGIHWVNIREARKTMSGT